MTSCAPDLLSKYLDNELSLPARRSFELHLKTCPRCRGDLRRMRTNDNIIVSWGSRRRMMPVNAQLRIARSIAKRRRLGPLARAGRMAPAAVGSSIAAVLVVLSVNLGVLYAGPGNRPVTGFHQADAQRLQRQSAPLVNARRSSAILGGSPVTTPAVLASRHPGVSYS